MTTNILLQVGDPTLFTYFSNSNFAGKIIVLALIVFSLIAWTIMIGKYLDLKRVHALNCDFEGKLNSAGSILSISKSSGYIGSFESIFRQAAKTFLGSTDKTTSVFIIKKTENEIDRAIAQEVISYESKLIFLGSIVTGAPFLGLLGTVWGVMDSFGAMALQSSATLQNIAPGVSGALLTTVAALLVAIPSVFGYNFLLTKVKMMVTELENFASALADKMEAELEESKLELNA